VPIYAVSASPMPNSGAASLAVASIRSLPSPMGPSTSTPGIASYERSARSANRDLVHEPRARCTDSTTRKRAVIWPMRWPVLVQSRRLLTGAAAMRRRYARALINSLIAGTCQ
jgi:hypothetical protein